MAFRLAHISDVHLAPLPDVRLPDLFSKRITGYINWRQNRAAHMAGGTVGQLVAAMAKKMPDHIAVTGDLTNLALDAEIVNAAAWLGELGNPEDVSVVPGNHDAYVRGALSKAVTAWRANMTSEAAGITVTRSGFPYLRRRGPVAIIGVNSAIATAPVHGVGHLLPKAGQGPRPASRPRRAIPAFSA